MANHLLGNDKVKSKFEYCCDKCGSESYEVGELRASGGFLSTFFQLQQTPFLFLIMQ
ncbi:zinc ribbon domain-containing protein [Vibrio diabolicus]|uniref:zinc ribbon domain-containing protein n=1 Tax=Vibrio diabolicus TaxID=50719 RepID=UPI004068F0FE